MNCNARMIYYWLLKQKSPGVVELVALAIVDMNFAYERYDNWYKLLGVYAAAARMRKS